MSVRPNITIELDRIQQTLARVLVAGMDIPMLP